MANIVHSNFTIPEAIHPAAYVQSSDPGAVGANKLWINTTGSAPFQLNKRNAANTGWDAIGQGGGSGAFSGEVSGTDFKATGLTGAVAGGRFVGAVASGHPTTGTFAVGDFTVDLTGALWVCTVAGTPGTWVETFINPMTTQGDLIVRGTSGAPARLATGTTGNVLTANGAGVTPSWQPVAGGGGGGTGGTGGSVVPIQTQTPSGVSSVAFTVPTGFKNIRVTGHGRTDRAANNSEWLSINFNGDATAANYFSEIYQEDSAASGADALGVAPSYLGAFPGATAPANSAGIIDCIIPDYAGTTFYKQWRSRGGEQLATGAANTRGEDAFGQWNNTTAIASLTISTATGSNFLSGTTFTLWGEADIGPVLLTANSNLIQETILTAAQATISIPNIPQGYRDLRITFSGRGDTAATRIVVNVQVNGLSSAIYDWANWEWNTNASTGADRATAGTSALLARMAAASAPSTAQGSFIAFFPGYADSTFEKSYHCTENYKEGDTSTNATTSGVTTGTIRATSPITSLALTPAAGNFVAGTVVRVYGEPAAAGGSSVGTGTRTRVSANQATASGTALVVPWNTNDQDANNQHLLNPTPGALSGTVAKTSGSNQLVGTTTTFTTSVAVGQLISVPGTATEQFVVVAIADNTHLTLSSNAANTASGQTATTLNTALVFRQAGMYHVDFGAYLAAVSTATVTVQIRLNGTTIIAQNDRNPINASAGYDVATDYPFQQWDYVEALVTQTSGAAVNLLTDQRTHFAVQSRPTVVAAVPYICIQDQKAQNTAGGTFTLGAWQTRTLNTVVSDIAGVSSLASNQITLPPGFYRVSITCPAFFVGHHQSRLRNITDTTTLLSGTSEFIPSTTTQAQSRSLITGKFQLTGTKVLEVQHQCGATEASDGFGTPANFGTEVYTSVEIWKEG